MLIPHTDLILKLIPQSLFLCMVSSSSAGNLEGLPGVLGNKGTWPFTFREQGIFSNNFKGTRELLRYIREQGNIDFLAISDFWTDFL